MTEPDGRPMEINDRQLDEILADFSALGRPTYLDDPALGFGHAALDRDDLGIPRFSPDLPQVPVALIERHQALWTHPDNPTPRQEVWTELALAQGMQRIGPLGVHRLPNLDGWLLGEWPRDGGGLQLQQPDGNLFVYALCTLPADWITAARHYGEVLVLHGPHLGLRIPSGDPDAEQRRATELATAREDGLVTGGLILWGRTLAP
ncbi:hypothetical protein ThrDRAFT_03911 [Frankia casuarinae]|nr:MULTISPECIES: hypothetical protein [unclassified Frankia]ETA00170.1 hypothetical protein CcI6DRAFT_04406 [Frankia sp. CcI6]EYT90452.1 hypothetical protein ThrDRAFT_03911 [Frankia casuarinae]